MSTMQDSLNSFLIRDRLELLLGRFPSLHVAVLGDFFLDKYLVIDPALAEPSVETGLEARQVVAIRCNPGAAGTVTNNLSALGVGQITALGVIGDDGQGYELLRGLEATRVQTDLLIRAPDRFTPTYTKPMVREANGERELERLDIKNRTALPPDLEDALLERLKDLLGGNQSPAAVILLDQVDQPNCGAITERIRSEISKIAAAHPDVLFFADSRAHIGEFRNVTIKPNVHEAARALELSFADATESSSAVIMGTRLAERTAKPVYLTLGAAGIAVCGVDGEDVVPAPPVDGPIDIVGAGDSASAGIVSSLCAGATPAEAAAVGNLCASVTIRKLGTTGTASPGEIRDAAASVI